MGRQFLKKIQEARARKEKEAKLIQYFINRKKKEETETNNEEEQKEAIKLAKQKSYIDSPYVSLLGSKSNEAYNTNNVIV